MDLWSSAPMCCFLEPSKPVCSALLSNSFCVLQPKAAFPILVYPVPAVSFHSLSIVPLQATPLFSSSWVSSLLFELSRLTPAGIWGGGCTKGPGSPPRWGGRGEHDGVRSGVIPVVRSKEVRCGSSWICLKHSYQRTAGNEEEGLSGDGSLELPIQALQQRLGLIGLKVLFCVMWLIRKTAHKQGELVPSVLGWEQTPVGNTRTFSGACVWGSTHGMERACYSSQ